MTESKKFYITTAIPYVNAAPHVGHAMEFVQTDAIAKSGTRRRLYEEGKYEQIACYNAKDVIATTALYKKWQEYLGDKSEFLNNTD